MTVIDGVEIDTIYKNNDIKKAIINNDPIEDFLHVILVISNPCLYKRRYILLNEFVNRIQKEETNVILYIVELCYGNQKFVVSKKDNPHHLQLRCDNPLWHKENMINLAVKNLLPSDYKAFAWIDADIEFENPSWAMDTLKILNGTKDIVQIYSHCVDLNQNNIAMNVFNSFGYKFTKEEPYSNVGINYWHPGFAWACTKKAYLKMNGLYDQGILGSGDNIMALSFINNGLKAINEFSSEEYKESILHFQNNVKNLRLGYVPGVIKHYFHGTKKNRRYTERWKILLDYNYSPKIHIKYNKEGILVPTNDCPGELLDSILNYFKERNEDEFYN